MRRIRFIAAGVTLLCITGAAQNQAARPELKILERYLGTWIYDGEDKTPGTGGRVSCTSTRRWISGGYFVESHRKCKTLHGDVDQVEVFGYDFQNRVYSYWGFNGSVVSTYTSPSMEGGRVIWTGTGVSAGNRCTEIFESPTASMDSCESSRDGGASWIPRSGGKLTKAQN